MKQEVTLYELYSRSIEEDGYGHWGGITSHFYIGDNSIAIAIDWNANCFIRHKSDFSNNKINLYWKIEGIDGAPYEIYFNLFKSAKAKSPTKNEKFAEMSLLNDTTIPITYKYKDWVCKINHEEPCGPEFLFPNTLRYYESWDSF